MNNPEGSQNSSNGPESSRFEHAQRILGEKLKEMREKVEVAEAMQREFIFQRAAAPNSQERELLERTKAYIREFFEKKFNQLGALVLGDKGSEVKGLQFDGKIGEVSCCAERRAMFNFLKKRQIDEQVKAIATARRDELPVGSKKVHYTESVGPCALCRDALNSLNSRARVIQPVEGNVKTVPVSILYPSKKLLLGEEGQDETDKEYRELLLKISEAFLWSDSDQRMIKAAGSKLESELLKDPKSRVLVAATGFSGELYTNSTPQLTRNPQSLIVDRPVEFQLVCEASENHDQLLTLVVLRDSKDKGQEIMLPSGVSRELIRQFHPLTSVIVDFGKDGLRKLPIEVLYPLVYKLRKRKNSVVFK